MRAKKGGNLCIPSTCTVGKHPAGGFVRSRCSSQGRPPASSFVLPPQRLHPLSRDLRPAEPATTRTSSLTLASSAPPSSAETRVILDTSLICPAKPGSGEHVLDGGLLLPLPCSAAVAKFVELVRRWRWGPVLDDHLGVGALLSRTRTKALRMRALPFSFAFLALPCRGHRPRSDHLPPRAHGISRRFSCPSKLPALSQSVTQKQCHSVDHVWPLTPPAPVCKTLSSRRQTRSSPPWPDRSPSKIDHRGMPLAPPRSSMPSSPWTLHVPPARGVLAAFVTNYHRPSPGGTIAPGCIAIAHRHASITIPPHLPLPLHCQLFLSAIGRFLSAE